MTRFACLVLLALSVAEAGNTLVPTYPPKWNAGRFCAESGTGLLTGAVAAAGLGLVGGLVGYVAGANDQEWGSLGWSALGAGVGVFAGYPLGAAYGVNKAGRCRGEHGRYWATLVGSYAGVLIGAYAFALRLHPAMLAVPAVLSPVCGAVGYNLSRPRVPAEQAVLDRLEPPSLSFAPVPGERRGVAVDARLVTVRF